MFAKIEVNGARTLTRCSRRAEAGGAGLSSGTQAIKWNFTKFLIDRSRRVVRRYAPSDKPEKLAGDIEAVLGLSLKRRTAPRDGAQPPLEPKPSLLDDAGPPRSRSGGAA